MQSMGSKNISHSEAINEPVMEIDNQLLNEASNDIRDEQIVIPETIPPPDTEDQPDSQETDTSSSTLSTPTTPSPPSTEDDNPPISASPRRRYAIFGISAGIVFLTAGADVANMLMSLNKADNDTPIPTIVVMGVTALVFSIGLNGKPVQQGLEKIREMIKTKKLSSQDSKLSTSKEWMARGCILLIGSWGIFTDVLTAIFFTSSIHSGYKFARSIPNKAWHTLIATIATGTALTSFLTETFSTLKIMRRILMGEIGFTHAYSTPFLRTPLLAITGSLTAVGALFDIVSSNVSAKKVLRKKHSLLIDILSFTNGITNFCFSGLFSMHAVDDCLHYLCESVAQRKIELVKITSFLLSLGLSFLLAYYTRPLNYSLLQEAVDNVSISNYILSIFSWIVLAEETTLVTAGLYEPLHTGVNQIANKITNKMSQLYTTLTEYCSSHLADPINTDEKQTLLPSNEKSDIETAITPNDITPTSNFYGTTDLTLFSSSKKSEKTAPTKIKRWECGII